MEVKWCEECMYRNVPDVCERCLQDGSNPNSRPSRFVSKFKQPVKSESTIEPNWKEMYERQVVEYNKLNEKHTEVLMISKELAGITEGLLGEIMSLKEIINMMKGGCGSNGCEIRGN